MTFNITIEQLFLLVVEIIGLVVGCYLLVVLKNANQLIVEVNKTLTKNQEKFDKVLLHIEELSGNTAHLSGELKNQFDNNKVLLSSIFQTGTDSMLLMNDATSRIGSVIANLNDIIKVVNRVIKKVL